MAPWNHNHDRCMAVTQCREISEIHLNYAAGGTTSFFLEQICSIRTDALPTECPDEHQRTTCLPLPLKLVWVSLILHAGGNGWKQVIMKLRIRRQSTMCRPTTNAKMNTRSIGFDPFNSHVAMNFSGYITPWWLTPMARTKNSVLWSV